MQSWFDEFWHAWPSNGMVYSRKGQKSECLARWVARDLDAEGAHIVAHVEWLKGTDAWLKNGGQFIPAPLVYINQQLWDGAEIPATAAVRPVLADGRPPSKCPDTVRGQLAAVRAKIRRVA
jgi:hypothetical protein